jgi:ABC-type uncharacterized transport system substrate-binding protein
MKLVVHKARDDADIEEAFKRFVEGQAGALIVGTGEFFNRRPKELVAHSARLHLPTLYQLRSFCLAGGLMSYGSSGTEAYRLTGNYVGRVLAGERPDHLPIIRPTKFELVINLGTAKALGLEFHPQLLAVADEVIE